ncbi:HalOD1 output domain-containing protein [Halobaculum sp. EA56]|uniref:HalOD1 output domain-containing protein n=1 Tax=Halobaculum sp. EA56 TaxID=3421648 RepID=UPI003EBDF495
MTDYGTPVEYLPDLDCYETTIDPAETRPVKGAISLVETVQEAEDLDLPPLYDVIDCDALDTLFIGGERRALVDRIELAYETEGFELEIDYTNGAATMRLYPDAASSLTTN